MEDKFEDALLRLKVESFFKCLGLCASFIIRGDIIFAQVKEEIWDRVRGIHVLGSNLLGQRLTDLVLNLEETSDTLAKYKGNLTYDAHKLFERRWLDQEKEVDALSVSLSEAQALREGPCTG